MKYSSSSIAIAAALCAAIGLGVYLRSNQFAETHQIPTSEAKEDGLTEGGKNSPPVGILTMHKIGDISGSTATTLLDTFARTITVEDKVHLARELNRAYFGSSALERKKISDALSAYLKQEENQEVARALALSHSRLYFDENTLSNLKAAYDRKALTFDDYYGELAHIFPGIGDGSVREDVVAEISGSHNRYAVDIISSMLHANESINLSEKEKANLQSFFMTNEPIFAGAADSFGYFDAIRYENWLVASARLNADHSTFGAEQFIAAKLLDVKTDPRALVAFAVSSYANSLTSEQQAAIQFSLIRSRAQDFIRKNPNAMGLQMIGSPLLKM